MAGNGERLMPELLRLLDRPVVGYGNGAPVEVVSEREHGGACVHPMLGPPVRAAIGGGRRSSGRTSGAPGPGRHSVADAPRPNEVVRIMAIADGGGLVNRFCAVPIRRD